MDSIRERTDSWLAAPLSFLLVTVNCLLDDALKSFSTFLKTLSSLLEKVKAAFGGGAACLACKTDNSKLIY